MMIFAPILQLLLAASNEVHCPARLREQLHALMITIWSLIVPEDLGLPERLRLLLPEQADRLKWHDLEQVVDLLEAFATTQDYELCIAIVRLRILIARLGGVHSQMRLGRIATLEMQMGSNFPVQKIT